MKKILISILVLNSIFISGLSASELTPAQQMIDVMGIEQLLLQDKKAQAIATEERLKVVMIQLQKLLSRMPKETSEEVDSLIRDMTNKMQYSWTVEDALKVFTEAWSNNYSDEKILEVVKKFSDPERRNELNMIFSVSTQLRNYINTSYTKSLEREFSEFVPKLQEIMKRGQ
ncbi:MAG: hypothetical protein MJK10_15365 [Pseudomonadales bacterium]|nr:hypothetical protein [Pseudomonadales bacterium]NRA17618.1 hypothetical protein [Oceanospirillaceae bacterium]